MTSETFLNGRVTLLCGDSREVLKGIADSSIDSVVCDPPYALVSVVQRFGNSPRSETTENIENPYGRTERGFMGQKWDTGETAFSAEFWTDVLRVLRPGGHACAFSGSATFDQLVGAMKVAGFHLRDSILDLIDIEPSVTAFLGSLSESQMAALMRLEDLSNPGGLLAWLYGTGFAKRGYIRNGDGEIVQEGWGGQLKPAFEPIILARKPLGKGLTVAGNVINHGTGAINIDGCRVGTDDDLRDGAGKLWSHYRGGEASAQRRYQNEGATNFALKPGPRGGDPMGRWPANIIHDGSDKVISSFPEAPGQQGALTGNEPSPTFSGSHIYGSMARTEASVPRGDSGSAARFFYTAKADADDRLGSKHPTVKPVDLMQWLCRLVTPKGGTVLDPFAGTGTTGEAAFREGFNAILIEREVEYQSDIRRRMALVMSGPEERKRESIKAKLGVVPFEAGSLFAGLEEAAE